MPPPRSEQPLLLFFGDSITEGFRLKRGEDYPSLINGALQRESLPYVAVNGGHSGDTVETALYRLDELLEQNPGTAAFVIQLGYNDAYAGYDPATVKENLRTVIRRVRKFKRDIPIFLFDVKLFRFFRDPFKSEFEAIYPEIAREEKITLLPALLDGVSERPGLLLEDGLHPNSRGMEIVADNVRKGLFPHLK